MSFIAQNPCLRPVSGIAFPLLVVSALALATSASRADTEDVVRVDGDRVSGTIDSADDMVRIPFRAEEGAAVTLTVSADRGSALHPRLVLLGTDRAEDAAAAAAVKSSGGGRTASLKGFVLPDTGLRYLEVRSADGSEGSFTLTTRAKHAASAAGPGTVEGGGTAEYRFVAPGGARAMFRVQADRGSGAAPSFVRLLGPDGQEISTDAARPIAGGFQVSNVALDAPGAYALVVGSPVGASGSFRASVRWTRDRFLPREFDAAGIVANPVVLSVSPEGGDITQSVTVRVTGDFVAAGAKVSLRSGFAAIAIPAKEVHADAQGLSFDLDLASCRDGLYAVVVTNPDGGTGTLPAAFRVTNVRATVGGVTPSSGRSDEVVRVAVTGAHMAPAADVALVSGGFRIPGAVVTGYGGQVEATFDLRDQPIGAWDVVVTNAGTQATVLAGAFNILMPLPPSLTSITPGENSTAPVVVTEITGVTFRIGVTVRLTRAEFQDIPGTSVQFISSTQLAATFDTTGAEPGAWDVTVTNTDGQSATLPEAFIIY